MARCDCHPGMVELARLVSMEKATSTKNRICTSAWSPTFGQK